MQGEGGPVGKIFQGREAKGGEAERYVETLKYLGSSPIYEWFSDSTWWSELIRGNTRYWNNLKRMHSKTLRCFDW